MPLAEKALIEKIRRHFAKPRIGQVRLGIGEDCAVVRIPANDEALVTTDFSIEGIHFRRDWHPAESVGHRCLARGLSDIAAMGGTPLAAFLSLGLPARLPQSWVDGFMRGFTQLANRFKVPLAGGDTAESPAGVLADVVLLGSVPVGNAITRSGARPGDVIYVTGALGGSAAAFEALTRKKKLLARNYERHYYPLPRIEVGRFLREHDLASSMIDLSDGLSTDLAHICEESGVGAEITAAWLPRASVGKLRTLVALGHALHGGEDYELLFTARNNQPVPSRIHRVAVTRIGQIIKGKHLFLNDGETRARLHVRGWEHFRRKLDHLNGRHVE